MNVFYLVRTVSGLFDVPLVDDPKQRFSQKRRFKKSEFPAKWPKKAFGASSAPVDFKEVAMVDGCMRARALHRPTIRPHAHPRATMRTAAACSSYAWPCAHPYLVATFAATL